MAYSKLPVSNTVLAWSKNRTAFSGENFRGASSPPPPDGGGGGGLSLSSSSLFFLPKIAKAKFLAAADNPVLTGGRHAAGPGGILVEPTEPCCRGSDRPERRSGEHQIRCTHARRSLHSATSHLPRSGPAEKGRAGAGSDRRGPKSCRRDD